MEGDRQAALEEINVLLRSTGVHDTGALDKELVEEGREDRGGAGLMVRGARSGGGRIIDGISAVATAASIIVVMGMLVGLWFGGKWLWRAVKPAEVAAGSYVVSCKPVALQEESTPVRLAHVAPLFLGQIKVPADEVSFARLGGRAQVLEGGDLVHHFHVSEGRLAIRYFEMADLVRSVSVIFNEELPFCVALQKVGLLNKKASFEVSDRGIVTPRKGGDGEVFAGGLVSIRTGSQGVSAIQVSKAH